MYRLAATLVVKKGEEVSMAPWLSLFSSIQAGVMKWQQQQQAAVLKTFLLALLSYSLGNDFPKCIRSNYKVFKDIRNVL